MFVDPFVAPPGHSCDANAWCVFDGKEVQVKPARDISIGEEITLAFVSENNYEDRTAELKSRWGVLLALALCVQKAFSEQQASCARTSWQSSRNIDQS